MYDIFCNRLKEILKQTKTQQKDICKAIGIPKQKLTNWKTGYTEPSLKDLALLSQYFEISTDYLLGLEDESGRKIYNVGIDINNNYGTINQTNHF